jgi:hypothetical protein
MDYRREDVPELHCIMARFCIFGKNRTETPKYKNLYLKSPFSIMNGTF